MQENFATQPYRVGKFGKHIGSLHLNALYDPLNKHYIAVDFQKIKQLNERKSLCQMVDEFDFTNPIIIIADRGYESLVTNLDPFLFTSEYLKVLYHLRWGIETSFRELKYALGLSHFYSKKIDLIIQEI